ncbi:MAG: hypothetical protein JO197_00125 [Acidobacteria bacterium]|nr:hypothetical protein [Acidobacteriota bacterium]
MNERRAAIFATIAAVSAAIVRLIPLGWLHPLNWDELELFSVANWIAHGRVPFRDFWEHHTPLAWFWYAPFTLLTSSPGADAVILLRWAQIPIWIATFWLTNLWMRNAGLGRFARWTAMGFALASSMFMLPAVEARIDSIACLFFMAALVMLQRDDTRSMFWAGALLCLAGFTNIRLGPPIVLTALLLRIVDRRERKWRGTTRANWLFIGAAAAFVACLLYFVATGSLAAFWREAFFENQRGAGLATAVAGGFVHRLFVPFGVRLIASDRWFDLASVDVGGIAIVVAGLIASIRALMRWRTPDDFFLLGYIQLCSLGFIAVMNFVYNYHFEIVVLVMIPLVAWLIDAWVIERVPRRAWIVAALALAWCVNGFASIFRGKELDLAYQDFIMREAQRRTKPDDVVWSGISWAIRREPAYWFWFLPDMTRQLVTHGYARPYDDVLRKPPGVVIVDHYALLWMITVQRDLAIYLHRHYIPVWRNLWIPAMNARLRAGARPVGWLAPVAGTYRIYASAELAKHGWYRDPLYIASYEAADAQRLTVTLPPPGTSAEIDWWIDDRPAKLNDVVTLQRGQRIAAALRSGEPVAVVLLPTKDRALFRQPPPGATLEAATTRVTHVPNFSVHID